MFTEERVESDASDRADGLCRQEADAWQTLHAGEVHEPTTNTTGATVVFRPYRKAFLVGALIVFVVMLLNVWYFGTDEPASFYGIFNIPGFVLLGVGFGGAACLLCLYAWSYLSNYEIVLDGCGIILPEHGRLTWDQIAEVRVFEVALGGIIGMTRLTLNDGRRIYVQWFQVGCRPSEFNRAFHLAYERARRCEEPEMSHHAR